MVATPEEFRPQLSIVEKTPQETWEQFPVTQEVIFYPKHIDQRGEAYTVGSLDSVMHVWRGQRNAGVEIPSSAVAYVFGGFHDQTLNTGEDRVLMYEQNSGDYIPSICIDHSGKVVVQESRRGKMSGSIAGDRVSLLHAMSFEERVGRIQNILGVSEVNPLTDGGCCLEIPREGDVERPLLYLMSDGRVAVTGSQVCTWLLSPRQEMQGTNDTVTITDYHETVRNRLEIHRGGDFRFTTDYKPLAHLPDVAQPTNQEHIFAREGIPFTVQGDNVLGFDFFTSRKNVDVCRVRLKLNNVLEKGSTINSFPAVCHVFCFGNVARSLNASLVRAINKNGLTGRRGQFPIDVELHGVSQFWRDYTGKGDPPIPSLQVKDFVVRE